MTSEKERLDALLEEEGGLTLALLQMTPHGITFNWLANMFAEGAPPLNPDIRAEIVEKLRFYADKVESGELDQRMKRIGSPIVRELKKSDEGKTN